MREIRMKSTPSLMPLAYLNGELVTFNEAVLPVYDLGVMQGATVTERLRTVRHQPYLVKEHLDRLERSLKAIGWGLPQDAGPLTDVISELALINCNLIGPNEDLGIVVFVTAGQSLWDSNGLIESSRPTVCIYTTPLPLQFWKAAYETGISLATPTIRQIPTTVIDPRIKHRSRLHWTVADQSVRKDYPGGAALLLDQNGFVTETSSGNLFIVKDGQLHTPREENTLGGIAQAQVIRLAEGRGWSVHRSDLTVDDVTSSQEAFLTSSTYCILPVSHLNGVRIGTSLPGPITKMLIDTWGAEMGLDFERQVLEASS